MKLPHINVPSRRLALAAGLALSTITSTSLAQTLNWNNVAGGSAGVAANWNPAQIPGPASLLVWNLPNTFTTTFPSGVSQSTSHTFKRGVVTLSMSTSHSTSSFVRVGDLSGDSTTTNLISGTLHAGTGVTVGNASGATGTLTIDNEGSLLDTTAAGSDIIIGNAGTGTLNIRDGASVVPADDVLVGLAATGVGTVTVTGTGGLPIPVPSSLLDLTGSGKDITVGSSGDGSFNVLAGARVNADEMFVGLNPGSNGGVTVGGIGGILNSHSQINIATSLHLGDNPGAGLSGGSSTFTVNSGGEVTVLGTTRIGDAGGVGSGTLTVNQGGVFTTGSLIASDTGGFFNLFGGELHVDGGSLQVANDVLTFEGGAGSVLYLENGAACTLSNAVSPFEALVVSNTSQGTLAVQSGSHLTVTAGDVILGNLGGSNGQLTLHDTGTTAAFPANRSLIVGDAGRGELNLDSGSHLSSGSVNLGRAATGTALVRVWNDTTVWDITGSLAIGGTASTAFGSGTMEIGSDIITGGTVNVTSGSPDTISVRVWGAGDSLTVGQRGTINTDGILRVEQGAEFTLAGGSAITGSIELRGLGTNYNMEGIAGGYLNLVEPSSTITLTGDLTLTSGNSPSIGLFNRGMIEIGDHQFTVATSPGPVTNAINTCHLGASGMVSCLVPLAVETACTLSGDGTVNAPINNSGSILSQGSGLTFTKILSGIGQGISGTTITFGNGGGFTGSGVFSNATPINAFAGSTITATGNLTMGSAASSSGFNGNLGRLVITGDFDVTLNDSFQAVVGDINFPNSASGSPSVRCSTSLGVAGTVTGNGTIGGDFDSQVHVSGVLSPGGVGTAGTIYLGGDSQLASNSRLDLDIIDADSADAVVTLVESPPDAPQSFFVSDIILGGTLNLSVDPSHLPVIGESHTIIACSSSAFATGRILGSFQTVNAPRHWTLVYQAAGIFNSERLLAVYCPADFNGDGTVDFFDYLDFVDAFSANLPDADFNGDNVIDFFDYLDYVDAFSAGCA